MLWSLLHVSWQTFWVSIGTSLIASSVFALINLHHKSKYTQFCEHLFEEWGIVHAYEKRSEITTPCIYLLKNNPKKIDISAIRLRSFIDTHKSTLTKLLKDGKTNIRLLLPNPKSSYAKAFQTLLRDKVLTQDSLDSVKDWLNEIAPDIRKKSLEIRYTDTIMTSMYQRIDDVIFMGPYINQTKSQDTFTLECLYKGTLGQILSDRFEEDFRNATIDPSSNPFVIEFIGMPGSGKTSCATHIMEKYPQMLYFTTEGVPSSEKDSPLTFNTRVSKFLNQYVSRIDQGTSLLLDRGVIDAKIWLQVHNADVENLNDNNFMQLMENVPSIPDEIPHYKFLFLTSPEKCLERRGIHRNKPDEWALEIKMLKKLQAAYLNLASIYDRSSQEKCESDDDSQISKWYIIDSTNMNIDDEIKTVSSYIDQIIKEHTPSKL